METAQEWLRRFFHAPQSCIVDALVGGEDKRGPENTSRKLRLRA